MDWPCPALRYGQTVRITEYTYDKVGNRLTKSLIQGVTRYDTTYDYDDMDRLLTETTTTTQLADAVAGPDDIWLAANPRRAGYFAFVGFCALAISAALAPLGWMGLSNRRRRRQVRHSSIALLMSVLMIVGPEQVHALGNDAAAVHAITTMAIGQAPPDSVIYTYDANGNMITKSQVGATPTLYTYDAENRLVMVDPQSTPADIVTYAYDDDGIRKSKSVGDSTTFYLTDKNRTFAQVLEERDGTGTLVVRYTYGHDLISQTRPGSGGGADVTRYYHYDGQMSTRLLSDENATPVVTDTYNYEAIGEQFDTNADLYYLRARYLSYSTSRFVGSDPAEGFTDSPITFHHYLYASSNPIGNIDPSGLSFVSTINNLLATAFIRATIFAIQHPIILTALGFAGNVLNKLPKNKQVKAKRMLHDIWMAETRADAHKAFDLFVASYELKYPKATECLARDRDALLAFYDFPAEQWAHIRTTNPIESTFATVRLRTKRTKGSGSRAACLAMVFKLTKCAERTWRALNGSTLLSDVIRGVQFIDGVKKQAA